MDDSKLILLRSESSQIALGVMKPQYRELQHVRGRFGVQSPDLKSRAMKFVSTKSTLPVKIFSDSSYIVHLVVIAYCF